MAPLQQPIDVYSFASFSQSDMRVTAIYSITVFLICHTTRRKRR